jgi:hypothetical protein
MSLKDTLTKLQEDEQQKLQWERDKPKHIKDWQDAVVALIAQIREYLGEYAADGSLTFTESEIELMEEGLGRYEIKTLSIVAGPATVLVRPVGTMIVGAFGRVDMYRQGRAGDFDRVLLLRMRTSPDDPTPRWAITLPPGLGTPTNGGLINRPMSSSLAQRAPLTKETLEQALDFLFR